MHWKQGNERPVVDPEHLVHDFNHRFVPFSHDISHYRLLRPLRGKYPVLLACLNDGPIRLCGLAHRGEDHES